MSAPAVKADPREPRDTAFPLTMSANICLDCRMRYLPLRGPCLCGGEDFQALGFCPAAAIAGGGVMAACSKQSTEEAIASTVARYFDREPDDLSDELLLDDDLGADDLGRRGLAFVLEERFGVTIEENAYSGWIKVGDIARSLTAIEGAGHG